MNARFDLGFSRVGTRAREIRGGYRERANERAREIISGARITIEHREPLRGIRAKRARSTRCTVPGQGTRNRRSRRRMAMGNNCAFALVAGEGFRGPPPRLPVVIIESLLSPSLRPAIEPSPRTLSPRPALLGCLTSPRNALLFSVLCVLLFGALSLGSAPSVYRASASIQQRSHHRPPRTAAPRHRKQL